MFYQFNISVASQPHKIEGATTSVSTKTGDENHDEMQAAKVIKHNDNAVTNTKYPIMTQLSLRATVDFANKKLAEDYMRKFRQFEQENKKDSHQSYYALVEVENLRIHVRHHNPIFQQMIQV